jgi:hypothetical protein
VIAVVDGACVSALSEGRDPRKLAHDLLLELRRANPVPPRVDD